MVESLEAKYEKLASTVVVEEAFKKSFKFTILNENATRDDIDNREAESHDCIMKIVHAVADEKFDMAKRIIEWTYQDRVTDELGDLVYPEASSALLAPFELADCDMEDFKGFLEVYKTWFHNSPDCAFAGGALVLAYGHVGFAYRGTDWWQNVPLLDKWAFESLLGKGNKVISKNKKKFKGHWFWDYCLHRYSIMQCPSKKEIIKRFENCLSHDPLNRNFYDIQAHAMLERWFGDELDMEQVARTYMENTADTLGKRGYAEIYDYPFSIDGPDFYTFNGKLMLEAVKEQLDVKWCQYTLTRYASCLFYSGDFKPFLSIMLNRLEKFYPQAWISALEPYTACKIAYEMIQHEKSAAA